MLFRRDLTQLALFSAMFPLKILYQTQGFLFIWTLDFVLLNAQGTPPWILKWCGLESSGRILISSNGKTKRIAIFLGGGGIFYFC